MKTDTILCYLMYRGLSQKLVSRFLLTEAPNQLRYNEYMHCTPIATVVGKARQRGRIGLDLLATRLRMSWLRK